MRNPDFDPTLFHAELEYKAENTTCTMCGKQFTTWDSQQGFGFDYTCGHGTRFEDQHIKIDLCCECFDEVMDFLIPLCKEDPILETERKYRGQIDDESGDRLIRLEKVLNNPLATDIITRLKNSSDCDSMLSEVESELRTKGFDIDSVPLDRNQYWKASREEYLKNIDLEKEDEHE